MVKFEGLDTPKGLGELNKHLTDRSYIEGFTPSAADTEVFGQLSSNADASKAPHVARWWNHINSFSDSERKAFPAAGQAEEKKAEKKEEDFDLFGEDEDDTWEKEVQKRADDHLAKAKPKKEALKSVVVIDVKPWEDTTDMVKM